MASHLSSNFAGSFPSCLLDLVLVFAPAALPNPSLNCMQAPSSPACWRGLGCSSGSGCRPSAEFGSRRADITGLQFPEAEEGFIDYRAFMKWLLEPAV